MSERYWGKPLNARRWHIFEDGRCICSSGWMMLNTNGDKDTVDTDEDTFRDGEDCKTCCRRAGLITDD